MSTPTTTAWDIPPLSRIDLYASFGLMDFMEPQTQVHLEEVAKKSLLDAFDSPHEHAWHVSMHASEFPGDPLSYCERYLAYRMANIPSDEPTPPWVSMTGDVGKAGELTIAKAWFDARESLAVPEDPTKPHLKQLGFVSPDYWATGSTDLPILPFGWKSPHIIEIKCLTGDTKVITDQGVRPIAALAGSEHVLLNGKGQWQKAPVRSFGTKKIWEIDVERSGRTKTLRSTGDHRWFVDGPWQGSRRLPVEVLASELEIGQKLSRCVPYSKITKGGNTKPSPFGIAQGIVYGDGTSQISGGGSTVDLFGEKDLQLLKFFEGCSRHPLGNGGLRIAGMPRFFKTSLPSHQEGVSYLYGWLAGYFAADGTISKSGEVVLDSSNRESLEYVQDLCTSLGITTKDIYDIVADKKLPQGDVIVDAKSYRLPIESWSLTEDFFLISEHRQRWLAAQVKAVEGKRRLQWTIVDVRETEQKEEVFCAVVKGTEQFVLDGFILTGNCKAHDVVEEMISGKWDHEMQQLRLRGPDKKHELQLKATIGYGHEDYDWGMVTVEEDTWKIMRSDVHERLGLKDGMLVDPQEYQRAVSAGETLTFKLEPPTTGQLYYWSRSWPRTTKSFWFSYDQDYMAKGKEVLARVRQSFIDDKLPQRDPSFQYGLDPCRYCNFSRICRDDSGLEPRRRKPSLPVTEHISESHAVRRARDLRGVHYSYARTRAAVFARWGEQDPIADRFPVDGTAEPVVNIAPGLVIKGILDE